MSIDPPYTAEFSNAGFLATIPDDLQTKLKQQSFKGAVDAATWGGQLVVAPFWSNTQVLWYRKSFAEKAGLDMAQPVTWDQIIDAAADNGGKVAVQANKYEGYSVWINALISGRRGRDRHQHRQGRRPHPRGRLPGGRDRGDDHREAGALPRRAARPVGLQRGHSGRHLRWAPGRVHGQLDLHLDELRQDPARREEGPRLRPVPAVDAGRGVPAAVRRDRRRGQRVLQPQGRGDAGDRVHHLSPRTRASTPSSPATCRPARPATTTRRWPRSTRSRCSTCSSRASTRRRHARSRRTGATSPARSRARGTRPTASTTRPHRTSQQFIEDVLQGRRLL